MRFVFVHGGFQGGWCWDKLVPELARLGHSAVCPDLPGHGERAGEAATLQGYRDAVLDVLEDGDILVGHSMGGYPAAMAADVSPRRLRRVIYLAAGHPLNGKSMVEAAPYTAQDLSANYSEVSTPSGPAWSIESQDVARRFFFHDCSDEDVEWAFSRLGPQPIAPLTEPITLRQPANTVTPCSYIVCTNDQCGHGPFVELFMERLGLDTAYPIWSSHYPFISRPADTAKLLDKIAQV